MTDLSKTIEAKSDQLNADDLMGGARTVKITNVSVVSGDQPISINYEGDCNKPYKPCKSMRRALIQVWGSDGKEYIGRSMTLYFDPNVTWAGQKVGGIRISHVSDIHKPKTLLLTSSRGKKSPFKIEPLVAEDKGDKAMKWVAKNVPVINGFNHIEELEEFEAENLNFIKKLTDYPEAFKLLEKTLIEKKEKLNDNTK